MRATHPPNQFNIDLAKRLNDIGVPFEFFTFERAVGFCERGFMLVVRDVDDSSIRVDLIDQRNGHTI